MPFHKVNRESKIVNRNSIYHLPFTINKRKGFTLIELLVVITIIALLIGAAAASYTKAQQKARDGKRKSDLKSVQQALELYFQQNGKYPDGIIGYIQCNITIPFDNTILPWGTSAFTCNSITYLKLLPKDPTNISGNTVYYYTSTGTPPNSYTISANLENDNDPDRITTGVPCTPQSYPARDYCVTNP